MEAHYTDVRITEKTLEGVKTNEYFSQNKFNLCFVICHSNANQNTNASIRNRKTGEASNDFT